MPKKKQPKDNVVEVNYDQIVWTKTRQDWFAARDYFIQTLGGAIKNIVMQVSPVYGIVECLICSEGEELETLAIVSVETAGDAEHGKFWTPPKEE